MALPVGKRIGPKNSAFWYGYARLEASTSYQSGKRFRGYWVGNPNDRYLGVRFLIDGAFHYGWIRLPITTTTQLHGPVMSAEITQYSYETVANQSINADKRRNRELRFRPRSIGDQRGPALGMLALGAEGLPLWRREETSVRQ